MDNPITFIALACLAGLGLLLAGLLLVVLRNQSQLRREQRQLAALLASQENDLAGIVAAGVNIDRLLIEHEQSLRECLERIESFGSESPQNHPYHAAIEKIKQGTEAGQLAKEFGFPLSEAELLVRLHGHAG